MTTQQVYNPKSFSTKNSGPYSIQNLSYPEGISQNLDMAHYVTFFINVRGKSKLFKENENKIVGYAPKISNTTSPAAALSILKVGGAFAGGAIGAQVIKQFPGSKVAIGAGVGIGASVALIPQMITADKTYRISDCITLHVQDSPSAKYGIKYADGDIGTLLSVISREGSLSSQSPETVGALLAAGINTFGKEGMRTAMNKATGQTLNPFKEVLFESVNYRQFRFDYTFMPKSKQESDAVQNIIKTFKVHMHPELSANSFFYINPSEFSIAYYFRNKENNYINKIATCVLTDMDVVYGGAQFSTFDDGAPVEINVTLHFQELAPLTRESILDEGL